MKHFEPNEFSCKCGCGLGVESMDKNLLSILDSAREAIGRPMRINSAVRCKVHNSKVGGSAKSEHVPENTHNGLTTGVDVHIPDSAFLYALCKHLYIHNVPRMGLNQQKMFLHIGLSKNHAQDVFFKY